MLGRPVAAAILTLLALALGAPRCLGSVRIIDRVDLSDAAAVRTHGASWTGGAPVREAATFGTLVLRVAGVRLMPGGTLSVRLRTPVEGATLWITLHTAPADFGKLQRLVVLADGREICRVEESDPGAGVARSLFVRAPSGRRTVSLAIRSDTRSEAPVIVASVAVCTGIEPAAGLPPDPRDRMAFALLTSRGHGYGIDQAEIHRIRDLIPRVARLDPQAAVLYAFSQRDPDRISREVAALAALAESSDFPLRIAPQMHWAGVPTGVPDGAGGTFTDPPYQMICYDPDDGVHEPAVRALMGDRYDVRFGLSVPNVWSDTPWLTFNHPRLNAHRRVRLTQFLGAWVRERERLARSARSRLLPLEMGTGEETIYWARGVDDSAFTRLNSGRPRQQLAADFNPFTVAAALQDQVELDPRDGLDRAERYWLHQNLARWQQTIVGWMLAALPSDPIRLDAGPPLFATDLARRNVFTEPYAMACFPMQGFDPTRPGLEVGYVRGARSGGAYWSGAQMQPWLRKQRELGRVALPNLESTGADDGQLAACIRAAYANGARFVTLYNWHHRPEIGELLRRVATTLDVAPVATWTPQPGTPPSSLRRGFVARADAYGANRVDLFAARRIEPGERYRVTVRIRGGGSASSVWESPAGGHAAGVPVRVWLPFLLPLTPGAPCEAWVEPLQSGAPAFAPASDGGLAIKVHADAAAERRRSIAIQDRQDAVDLIACLRERGRNLTAQARSALAEAEEALRLGDPRGAYIRGIAAEQLTLPAQFAVPRGGARLAPYNVHVVCPTDGVRAALTAYDRDRVRIQVRSPVSQTVTLRWRGRQTSGLASPGFPLELELVERSVERPVRRRAAPARPRRPAAPTRPLPGAVPRPVDPAAGILYPAR